MMGNKSRKIPDMYSTSSHASMGYHYSQKSCSNTVAELGEKDFSAGLTFVAISHIKTLKGLGPVRQLWFQIGAREISAPKFEMVQFQVAARSKFVPLFGSHSKLCTV